MDMLEEFFRSNNLDNPDDIDALLECASLVRQLISEEQYPDINRVINYTIDSNFSEAFSWTMEILQEMFEKENCTLTDFYCPVGGCIANYNEFVASLQVDFNALKNHIEKVYDNNGEVEAFFNVMVYRTRFENIYLISSENFDNKDNDYIQYKLFFTGQTDLYNN